MLCKEIIWIFVIWLAQVFYFEFDTSHKTILSNGKEKFVLATSESVENFRNFFFQFFFLKHGLKWLKMHFKHNLYIYRVLQNIC